MRVPVLVSIAVAAAALTSPALAGGNGPSTFAGKPGHEVVTDPAFLRSAPPGAPESLPRLMETSATAKETEGGFVTVQGCAAHLCPLRGGFLATGKSESMFAAWTVKGRAGVRTSVNAAWSRAFGPPGSGGEFLPPPVAERFGEWLGTLETDGSR